MASHATAVVEDRSEAASHRLDGLELAPAAVKSGQLVSAQAGQWVTTLRCAAGRCTLRCLGRRLHEAFGPGCGAGFCAAVAVASTARQVDKARVILPSAIGLEIGVMDISVASNPRQRIGVGTKFRQKSTPRRRTNSPWPALCRTAPAGLPVCAPNVVKLSRRAHTATTICGPNPELMRVRLVYTLSFWLLAVRQRAGDGHCHTLAFAPGFSSLPAGA